MHPPPSPPSAAPEPARRRVLTGLGLLVSAGAVGTAAYGSITSASAGGDLRSSLTVIAPAAAGGGWDTCARELQAAQRAQSIVNNTQVLNIPGAGGTIALGNLTTLAGRPETIMVGGTGQLAATIQYDTDVTLADVTHLATIVAEIGVVVVKADAPYATLEDLAEAWRADPGAVPWTGGGSFDQLVVTSLAIASGVDPIDMTYISSDGGGEATQAVLNGTAVAATGGYPDNKDLIASGRFKALALVAEEPHPTIDIPTTVEQGFDVTLTNWRSLHAPPGIAEEARAELVGIIQETVATPEWKDAIDRFSWMPVERYGEELQEFLDAQKTEITALYEELGA
ncbi:tripartite tricarboxylate transporter substrate binding protein [Brachybacterium hainanense]|uniref:Tripartite tricarboxylate transporter substrate binding protein n=1 Tax=Brachybacterium hainanense TaxID=1541174 RepID=A0ABV6R7J4_9MICO